MIFAVMSVMILALVSVFSILLLNTDRRELKEASCNYENFSFSCIQRTASKVVSSIVRRFGKDRCDDMKLLSYLSDCSSCSKQRI